MELQKLQEIMKEFEASAYGEIRLQTDAVTLVLTRDREADHERSDREADHERSERAAADVDADADVRQKEAVGAADAVRGMIVSAQMAGTFYTSPKPGDPPFVREGSRVSAGETLGLLEAMKVISEITAPAGGVIQKVFLADETFAEFEAPLFEIKTES